MAGTVDPRVDVISIGALSRHILWEEAAPVRAAHATTTLIRDAELTILVDPGLPAEVLVQRLDERTGLKPSQIDAVFLTSFSPVHRRGIELFSEADWWMSEVEHQFAAEAIGRVLDGDQPEGVSYEGIEQESALLGRLKPAPDSLSGSIDLFPAYGATPGNAALVVKAARTIVVAGDAVVSRGHFEAGRVWERSGDPEEAKNAFLEIREIADAIVPGHDNIIFVG